MSDANDVYNVEKILRRKLVDDEVNIFTNKFLNFDLCVQNPDFCGQNFTFLQF